MSLIGLLTATEKQVHLGRLHMRPIQWHLKNNWRVPESLEKAISVPRSLHPMYNGGWRRAVCSQVNHTPHVHTPNKTCSANIYRRIKRKVKCSQTHCKRVLVTARKQAAYKLSGTKSSLSNYKRVPRPLLREDSTWGNRQLYSSVIHKQRRNHEVGPALCPTVENLDLMYQEANNSLSLTHSRPAEYDGRQAIQARPDHPNRVVSPSRGLPSNMHAFPPAAILSKVF